MFGLGDGFMKFRIKRFSDSADRFQTMFFDSVKKKLFRHFNTHDGVFACFILASVLQCQVEIVKGWQKIRKNGFRRISHLFVFFFLQAFFKIFHFCQSTDAGIFSFFEYCAVRADKRLAVLRI